MKPHEKEEVYRLVFDDLISNYGGLYRGVYDARYKSGFDFMTGVFTVMELIAHNAGGKEEILNAIFTTNMEESEIKAGKDKWKW